MKNCKGFTLIELLLVVVIIGLMLAVIVPRAWRANVDAKYGLVRQNCSELASFAQQWAESQILAQNESTSTATIGRYFNTLAGNQFPIPLYGTTADWVGNNGPRNSNWNLSAQAAGILVPVPGRNQGTATNVPPEVSVEGTLPPEKVIVNPFNGVNVFAAPNDPTGLSTPIPGAISCATIPEPSGGISWHYYGLLYAGTDSTTTGVNTKTSYYAGLGPDSIGGVRNGVFMARLGQ